VIRRGKKDGNHDAIVARLESLGCTVAQMHACGVPGFPDVAVGAIGQTRLVEIKDPTTRYGRAGLNANQSVFARDWRGGQVYVITSPDEAAAFVQQWRRM
jgi:hypothetical protein